MKKNLFMTVLILSLFLLGCGNGNTPANNETKPPVDKKVPEHQTISETRPKETSAPETEAETSVIVEDNESIQEQVVFDQNDIKITAKQLDEGFSGPEISFLVENNSNETIVVQARNTSVNNYMIDAIMSIDVAPGKKANGAMSFIDKYLADCGIDKIQTIEFNLHIFNDDTLDTISDTDLISLTTSNSTYEQVYDDTGDVLYDENNIKIVYKGISEDGLSPQAMLYIENNTEQNITVQIRDESINGFMISGIFSSEISKGKKALSGISFLDTYLEENGITEIETIELKFHIFETESMTAIKDTEVITINAKQ